VLFFFFFFFFFFLKQSIITLAQKLAMGSINSSLNMLHIIVGSIGDFIFTLKTPKQTLIKSRLSFFQCSFYLIEDELKIIIKRNLFFFFFFFFFFFILKVYRILNINSVLIIWKKKKINEVELNQFLQEYIYIYIYIWKYHTIIIIQKKKKLSYDHNHPKKKKVTWYLFSSCSWFLFNSLNLLYISITL